MENVRDVLPQRVVLHALLHIVLELERFQVHEEAARIVGYLGLGVIGRQVTADEEVQRSHALLAVEQDAHGALLFVVAVGTLEFRRLRRLPGQHHTGGVRFDEGIDELFGVVALPDVLALERGDEELALVDFVENRADLHIASWYRATALGTRISPEMSFGRSAARNAPSDRDSSTISSLRRRIACAR